MNAEINQSPVELRAGPVVAMFDVRNGSLRAVRWAGRDVLRGIYSAVRDPNWGTVAPTLSDLAIEQSEVSFRVTFRARCKKDPIDFVWNGEITGNPDGTIVYAMQGRAESTFLRNRIGFCVLHPIEPCAGRSCLVGKTDGSLEQGRFPSLIAKDAPFLDMTSISHEVVPGLWAKVVFDGDVFEMEDQRNWTDASFKTFCTPLSLPYPVEVAAGTTVEQSVTLSFEGEAAGAASITSIAEDGQNQPIQLSFGPEVALPRLGLCMASHRRGLDEAELTLLKALKLDHLRADLRLFGPGWEDELGRASRQAKGLEISLHAALFLGPSPADELGQLRRMIDRLKPPVAAWLVFDQASYCTTEQELQMAREILGPYDESAMFGGGTDAYFAELNCLRPAVDKVDLLCYSIQAQEHAQDCESIMETLETHPQTVQTARSFGGRVQIAVSPITLKARFNPYASQTPAKLKPGELPPQVDLRQASAFAAAWTLGSIIRLAEAATYSATYFETSGLRGVMPCDAEPPPSADWPRGPGAVYPIYHALAAAAELAAGPATAIIISQPQKVLGLADAACDRLVLVNLTDRQQTVRLPWDDQPGSLWWDFAALVPPYLLDGPLLVLEPYAVVRVVKANGPVR